MSRLEDLLTGDVDKIADNIKKYIVADLKKARDQLESEGKTRTLRYDVIVNELQRRRDYNKSRYEPDTYRGKGFTEEEWKDFSRRWRDACNAIKGAKRGKR